MKKVLIIDDDPGIRESLKTILEGKYELQEAGNRKEGMTVLKESIPDLIVLDVMMEDLDSGFEMAREIGQDEELKDTKILVITSADKKMELAFEEFAGDPDQTIAGRNSSRRVRSSLPGCRCGCRARRILRLTS